MILCIKNQGRNIQNMQEYAEKMAEYAKNIHFEARKKLEKWVTIRKTVVSRIVKKGKSKPPAWGTPAASSHRDMFLAIGHC